MPLCSQYAKGCTSMPRIHDRAARSIHLLLRIYAWQWHGQDIHRNMLCEMKGCSGSPALLSGKACSDDLLMRTTKRAQDQHRIAQVNCARLDPVCSRSSGQRYIVYRTCLKLSYTIFSWPAIPWYVTPSQYHTLTSRGGVISASWCHTLIRHLTASPKPVLS